ncbi:nucleoside diphosphate kinase-like [Adelges cooleyi]|uniref:nucleoside diphosphate kinase-like n=1 Tax=Adelges cooleyi TaxID=133065 RepID=UPI0021800E40|nr:nucleoside diphosphate kinase-like isoform X1 [Adelges cooleyi]XP_050427592.1 nucleoside diphosphate kinase-like [Adelges cooleyi]
MGDPNVERTFIMIKPDGVHRGLVGKIIKRFESKGFKLVAMKFMWPSEQLMREHYSDLSNSQFFPGFIKYMLSGPVIPMVWEGLDAVKIARFLLRATNRKDANPGTVRGDLCTQTEHSGPNVIHGADAVEAAEREIGLWFTEKEMVTWTRTVDTWVYE